MGLKRRIDVAVMASKARALVIEAADTAGLTGLERRKLAARELAKWADEQVNPRGWFWRWLDKHDDGAWLALAEGAVELAYQALKGEGARV